jgi:hypothetical protein
MPEGLGQPIRAGLEDAMGLLVRLHTEYKGHQRSLQWLFTLTRGSSDSGKASPSSEAGHALFRY